MAASFLKGAKLICPSKASLLMRLRALEENTKWNSDRLVIQLATD